MAKVLDGSAKKKQFVVDMPDAEVMQVYNVINILLKYNWHLNLIDDEVTVNLGL